MEVRDQDSGTKGNGMKLDIVKTAAGEFILTCDLAAFTVVATSLRQLSGLMAPDVGDAPIRRHVAQLRMAAAIVDEWLAK